MSEAKVWVEKVLIPTYEIGEAEKNPIFLDKRVWRWVISVWVTGRKRGIIG